MKRALFSIFSMTLILIAQAQNEQVINDRNAQSRQAHGFHAIHISSGIDLYLSQGPEALAVSASSVEDRDRIKTEVENGVLNIYLDDKVFGWNRSARHMKAYVSASTLDELHASGGSDVYIENEINSAVLHIRLSGGSDLKGKLNVRELSFDQTGGSDVHVSGVAANLDIKASGGSDFIGYDLVSETCHISSSGGSDARLTVNKELSAAASGGSDIYYKGNCSVRETHSGGSSTIRKE